MLALAEYYNFTIAAVVVATMYTQAEYVKFQNLGYICTCTCTIKFYSATTL